MELVDSLMPEGQVLTALDSATSDDPRERGVAMRVLEDSLNGFGGRG